MRGPCITGAIADSHLILLGRIAVQRDAFVINLDLFARLEIVVDHHLVGAANQRPAHFHGSQPVNVNMSNQI